MESMYIPGYKIVDTLGEGGMATVYLAIQESFEREVALKVLDPKVSKDPSFGERFLREARIVSRLVHPNIVTVYDVGTHEGLHFLSMEYVPGRDLKHRRFELSLIETIQVLKDVARALDYAARKGCVHRDVKPDNIMLHAEDGRAVLMDFGIARIADFVSSMTQTGTAVGTPHYMSPEQARGASVDARSDLYSLGVVTFLLLTGYLPYDSDSAVSIGVMHISDTIPRLPAHLAPFQALIDRALAKDPDDRFQSGAEFCAALAAFSEEELVVIEQAGERALMSEIMAETPTVHQPVAWSALTGTEESTREVAPVSGKPAPEPESLYAQRDDDQVRPSGGSERRGGWFWKLLFVAGLGGAVYYYQVPLLNYWENSVDLSELERRLPSMDEIPTPFESEEEPERVSETEGTVSGIDRTGREVDSTVEAITDSPAPEPDPVFDLAEVEPLPLEQREPSVEEPSTPEGGFTRDALTEVAGSRLEEAPVADAVGASGPEAGQMDEVGQADETEEIGETETKVPSDRERALELGQRARRTAEAGELNEALNWVDEGLSLYPESEALKLERDRLQGRIQARRERERQAQERSAELKELEQLQARAERLLEEGDWEAAGRLLGPARERYPGSPGLLSLAARASELEEAAQRPAIERLRISQEPLVSLAASQPGKVAGGRVLHAGFSFRNFAETSAVIQAILYDGSRRTQIAQVPVIIREREGESFFRIERPVTGFTEGSYVLDLLVDGERMASTAFQVE